MQHNINGIKGKLDQLTHHLEKHEIKVAAIQESKATEKSKLPSIPNYTMLRRDRGKDKGGGLIFLIHDSVPFREIKQPNNIKNDPHIEELSIAIISGSKEPDLHIRNVYVPPTSSCSQGYMPNFKLLSEDLPEPFLIIGDVNAHHQQIYSQDQDDPRGIKVTEWLADEDLGLLNQDCPTRSTSNSNTAPDISVASASILPTSSWTTISALSSDHLPIHIELSTEPKLINAPKRTFINFNKADWPGFQDYVDTNLSNFPLS